MKKRIISFLLAIAMASCLLPPMAIEASAVETYVVGNGVTIPNSDVPADGTNKYCNCGISVGFGYHRCCWNYGYHAFYHIWGEYPNKAEDSMLYLRNVPAEERTLTADNLRKYLEHAAAGALVRLDKSSVASAGDSNGHTLIFIQMNDSGDGAIMLEGNYDGHGRTRIEDWTFDRLVASYGPDSSHGYQYIKYILWPDAPAYAASTECFTVTFDANGGSGAPGSISVAGNGTFALPDPIPHQFGSNFYGWATSADAKHADYQPGDTVTVTEDLILYALWSDHCMEAPDNISFSVTIAYPGQGYYLTIVPQVDDIYVMKSLDASDTKAVLYDAGGNVLTESDDANGTAQFQIEHQLYAGKTYYLHVAFLSLEEIGNIPLQIWQNQGHICQFIAHPKAPTCTDNGCTYYICSECGNSYLDDIIPATGHTNIAVSVVEPGCETAGYTIFGCSICGYFSVGDVTEPLGHSYVNGKCQYCGETDPDVVLTGDANGDGIINYLDAMLIAQYYVGDIGEAGLNLDAADVNRDGTVNYLDAMMVAQYYVGDIDDFPV